MTSTTTIADGGVVLLAVSLAMGHAEHHLINWATFLLGSVLVIVGSGRLFFLDER